VVCAGALGPVRGGPGPPFVIERGAAPWRGWRDARGVPRGGSSRMPGPVVPRTARRAAGGGSDGTIPGSGILGVAPRVRGTRWTRAAARFGGTRAAARSGPGLRLGVLHQSFWGHPRGGYHSGALLQASLYRPLGPACRGGQPPYSSWKPGSLAWGSCAPIEAGEELVERARVQVYARHCGEARGPCSGRATGPFASVTMGIVKHRSSSSSSRLSTVRLALASAVSAYQTVVGWTARPGPPAPRTPPRPGDSSPPGSSPSASSPHGVGDARVRVRERVP